MYYSLVRTIVEGSSPKKVVSLLSAFLKYRIFSGIYCWLTAENHTTLVFVNQHYKGCNFNKVYELFSLYFIYEAESSEDTC